ncbi:MAG: hypothetical protein AAF587_30465 [Bacteroidota bacterium]
MKHLFLFSCLLASILLSSSSQIVPKVPSSSLVGAWMLETVNGEPISEEGRQIVRIISDTYTMEASYNLVDKTFEYATGGPYTFDGEKGLFTTDYHSQQSDLVGTRRAVSIQIEDGQASVSGKGPSGEEFSSSWKQLDQANTPLSGSWRISERMRDDNMVPMKRGPRKTIKILSGSRFQWAAMNTETKQFMGTGGGSYTFENGQYTETIEFFSRDNSRVGMSLGFQGKVVDDAWHHSGKSSKGNPIKEIWRQE